MKGSDHSCFLGTGEMGIELFNLFNARSPALEGGKKLFLPNSNGRDNPNSGYTNAIRHVYLSSIAGTLALT
jgi:hypothetical protein